MASGFMAGCMVDTKRSCTFFGSGDAIAANTLPVPPDNKCMPSRMCHAHIHHTQPSFAIIRNAAATSNKLVDTGSIALEGRFLYRIVSLPLDESPIFQLLARLDRDSRPWSMMTSMAIRVMDSVRW
jgi:hypothetical protein